MQSLMGSLFFVWTCRLHSLKSERLTPITMYSRSGHSLKFSQQREAHLGPGFLSPEYALPMGYLFFMKRCHLGEHRTVNGFVSSPGFMASLPPLPVLRCRYVTIRLSGHLSAQ
jgi:hypothetical protein